jgi:hypothetical protein
LGLGRTEVGLSKRSFEQSTIEGKEEVWTPDLQKEHINFLEMKAVLALSHLQSLLQNKSLVLASDNTTTVAYLQNQGGTHCYKLYEKQTLGVCN